jgi:hypothetical protein
MAMSHMRIAGIGGRFVFCQNMSGPSSLGGRLYIGVMYADLVGTDHAPHTQAGGFGPAQSFLSFFLYFFFVFSFPFCFLHFLKAILNSKFQNFVFKNSFFCMKYFEN